MKFNFVKKINDNLETDEINITIEANSSTEIEKLIAYIGEFSKKIVAYKNYEIVLLNMNDVIVFYSDKKNNYCRTSEGTYRIKNRLYEIENMSNDFIRISKSSIVNIYQVEYFDIGETGNIEVKLKDGTNEFVSRRKIKDVMKWLDERSE